MRKLITGWIVLALLLPLAALAIEVYHHSITSAPATVLPIPQLCQENHQAKEPVA